MQIYFGHPRSPVCMDSTRRYSLGDLMSTCQSLLDNGSTLSLEYHPLVFLRLSDPSRLEMACEMVVGYHEHLRAYMDPSVWASSEPSWLPDDLFESHRPSKDAAPFRYRPLLAPIVGADPPGCTALPSPRLAQSGQ